MRKIIFDTDLGSDCDDVMALDVLLAADKAGDCKLLGVTYSAAAHTGVQCIHAILRQHGYGDIPLGRIPCPEGFVKRNDVYATAVAEAFPYKDAPTYESTIDADSLFRQLLKKNDDVTLVVTGFLSNIAALLRTKDGCELIRDHVCEIAIMGGCFSHITCAFPPEDCIAEDNSIKPHAEWNILWDIPAAQDVCSLSPVPLVFLPYEVGLDMLSGKPMTERGEGKVPDSFAYIIHGSANGRHSWDPATALYAVYGAKPWFYKSASGKVTVRDNGLTDFAICPEGKHFILACAMMKNEIAAELDRLSLTL
ncbi:MAG: hypothetical protein GX633_08885 [Clostridiales bacterium]|nr:hypothetical protein [Clostridiales bacterium]